VIHTLTCHSCIIYNTLYVFRHTSIYEYQRRIMSQHSNTLHPQTHMNTSGRECVGTCTCTIRWQEFRIVNWCSFQEFYCSQVSSSRQWVAGFPIEHHCRKISWLRAVCWYFLKSLRMCISATAQQVFLKRITKGGVLWRGHMASNLQMCCKIANLRHLAVSTWGIKSWGHKSTTSFALGFSAANSLAATCHMLST
jgi:hypothetical protein